MYVEKSIKSLEFSSDFAIFVVFFLICQFSVTLCLKSGLTSCRYINITNFEPTVSYGFD
jgi:hypothetical protein